PASSFWLTTERRPPALASVSPSGSRPAGAVVSTTSVVASMTLTLSELLLAAKTRRPSGLTATPRGRLPTAMVLTTARVVASITVTSSDFSLVTNTRASALASAGRMTRTSRTSRTSVPSNLGSIDVPSGAPSGWSVGPRFPYLLFDRQGPRSATGYGAFHPRAAGALRRPPRGGKARWRRRPARCGGTSRGRRRGRRDTPARRDASSPRRGW